MRKLTTINKIPKTTHAGIKDQMYDFLRHRFPNVEIIGMPAGGRAEGRLAAGTPDFYCTGLQKIKPEQIYEGYVQPIVNAAWVEVKTQSDTIKPTQVKRIAALRAAGDFVIIARSAAELQDVIFGRLLVSDIERQISEPKKRMLKMKEVPLWEIPSTKVSKNVKAKPETNTKPSSPRQSRAKKPLM